MKVHETPIENVTRVYSAVTMYAPGAVHILYHSTVSLCPGFIRKNARRERNAGNRLPLPGDRYASYTISQRTKVTTAYTETVSRVVEE